MCGKMEQLGGFVVLGTLTFCVEKGITTLDKVAIYVWGNGTAGGFVVLGTLTFVWRRALPLQTRSRYVCGEMEQRGGFVVLGTRNVSGLYDRLKHTRSVCVNTSADQI